MIQLDPGGQKQTRQRTLTWVAGIILLAALLVIGLYRYLLSVDMITRADFTRLAWLSVFLAGMCGVSLYLVRKSRLAAAGWYLLLGISISAPLGVLLVENVGIALGSAAALAVLFISPLVLDPRRVRTAAWIGVASGAACVVLDLFLTIPRTSIPALEVYLPVATVAVLLILGLLILRNFPRYSLRVQLVIVFMAIVAASLVGLNLALRRTIQDALVRQIGAGFTAQASGISGIVAQYFREKVGQLQVLAVADLVESSAEARNASYSGTEAEILAGILALDERWRNAPGDDPLIVGTIAPDKNVNPLAFELAEFSNAFPGHVEIFVTDRYGAVVAANNRLTDYYQADEEWWQAAWNDGKGGIYISDPEIDQSAGVVGVQIAVPIFGEETGEIAGILRSTLVLNDLKSLIERVSIGTTGYAVLLDREGGILVDPLAGVEGPGTAGVSLALRQGFARAAAGNDLALDEHGDRSIFGHASIAGNRAPGEPSLDPGEDAVFQAALTRLGWAVLIRQEEYEALAPVEQITRVIVLSSLVIGAGAAIVAIRLAGRIAGPVSALSEAAQAMGAGNLNAPLPPAGQDEIGRLTASFGEMAARLRETLSRMERRIAERTQALTTSLEVSRRLSTILDEAELITTVVNEVRNAFGYYHAHIYLLEPGGRRLVMAAGTGNTGRQMLAQGYAITVGEGLIGQAAQTLEIVLVPDVSQRSAYVPNPLLPDTKAEIAIPIVAREALLGVLDVQHSVRDGLSGTDANLLESIANQVAIGLQNARSFEITRRRAAQETLINEIAQKIQRATTIDAVLQTAARELGQIEGAKSATVRLGLAPDADPSHRA